MGFARINNMTKLEKIWENSERNPELTCKIKMNIVFCPKYSKI
mgnify:CR=1 FL=1